MIVGGEERECSCPCKKLPSYLSSFTAAEHGNVGALSRAGIASLANRRDSVGNTPLHLAAQHGHVSTTLILLKAGCYSNSGTSGATPLHRASFSGSVATMQLLLEQDITCDLLAADTSFGDHMTALHKAVSGGRFLAVQLLLDTLKSRHLLEKALTALDNQGRTPLQLAVELRNRSRNPVEADEMLRSVTRWNQVSGGPPDWALCLELLQEACTSMSETIPAERTKHDESSTQWPRRPLQESCLDCNDGRQCVTAAWERSFQNALSMRVEKLATLHLSDTGPLVAMKGGEKQGPLPIQSQEPFMSNTSSEPEFTAGTSSSKPAECLGRACSRCGQICLVLFPRGDNKLLCRTCRKHR